MKRSTTANTSPVSGMEYHQVTKLVEEDQLCRKMSKEGQAHYWAALESEVGKIRGMILLYAAPETLSRVFCVVLVSLIQGRF